MAERLVNRREEWGEEKCPRTVGSTVKVFPELVQKKVRVSEPAGLNPKEIAGQLQV